MADVLTMPQAEIGEATGWWPVDILIATFYVGMAALLAIFRAGVPGWQGLVLLHGAAVALIVFAVAHSHERWSWIFRHWYPLFYVAFCYKEMSWLIPASGRVPLDTELARLDHWIWGANPTVWLERVTFPWLTEFLQLAYSLFVPAVLVVAVILWRQGRYGEFRYYAFIIALGFLTSYVGYLLVPARGPRFLLAHLQSFELRGVWSFEFLQNLLNRIESAHYDCFPSGHTELTLLAWWGSREIGRNFSRLFFVYTLSILLATIYLRYHYTVDVLAGAIVATVVVAIAPRVYCEALNWKRSKLYR